MNPNNTLAAKEQVAHHLTSTWLGDLPSALPACFLPSRDGLFVVEGQTPTAKDFEAAVSTMSAMVNMTSHLKSSFNFMLGDALRLSKQVLGEAEAQRIKEEFLLHNGRVEHTVDEVERVCEGFPCPEDRRGLEYTHLQLLLPKKNDFLKGEITEEEYQAWVDTARDGEKTILNGEVVAIRPISCSKLRAKIQEASGKAPRVRATLSDPTHDSERLRLAEEVCRQVTEVKALAQPSTSLTEQMELEDAYQALFPLVDAWEAHMAQRNGSKPKDSRKRIPRFFIQPTKSFPEHAPQREEYEDDESFFDACEVYDKEWLETYICEDQNCKNSDCPQHQPSTKSEWRAALSSQRKENLS